MYEDRAGRESWWRRIRVRISVRTLLALVLVAASWLGWLAYSARVQREAVATIERYLGSVFYDGKYHNPRFARTSGPGWRGWLGDALGVDYVACVTEVHVKLDHPGRESAETCLASIGRLTRLESLSIRMGVGSVGSGLAPLRGLSHLKHLRLEAIREATPQLIVDT